MRYENLGYLLLNSSSSKRYFDSLPDEVRGSLWGQKNFIHTQYELRRNADFLKKYEHLR